jgi:hypothetical protein
MAILFIAFAGAMGLLVTSFLYLLIVFESRELSGPPPSKPQPLERTRPTRNVPDSSIIFPTIRTAPK